jgi:hypothetical protein
METSLNIPETKRKQSDPRASNAARCRIDYSDAEIVGHLRRLGYDASYHELAFTTESVADFALARLTRWHRPGHLLTQQGGGLLIVERAQPHPRQCSRDVVVVSLGGARVIMGALDPPDCSIGVPRYAQTM